jgi:NAD(P)-dependent dehydrogenase (short-subunit alcohol dehydrogenase family)
MGNLASTVFTSGWPLFFWVQSGFDPSDIPDQSGKVVLITGANSGVGYVSARELYRAGAKVYLACRTESKAREAIKQIGFGKGSLHFLQLDLADLDSVRRAADEVLAKEKRLDVLIANAGIMAT